jgi:hypothetical protein
MIYSLGIRCIVAAVCIALTAGCSGDDASMMNPPSTSGDPNNIASQCPPGVSPVSFGGVEGSANYGIVTDASGVYWTDFNGSLMKAGPSGKDPAPLATGLSLPGILAVDADTVYFVEYGAALSRIPKAGGSPVVLAQGPIDALAVDKTHVYFTSTEGVSRVEKAGGAMPELLAQASGATSIGLDDTTVYVTITGDSAGPKGVIGSVPKAGGELKVVVQDAPFELRYLSQELAVDATNVYWLNTGAGKLMKAPKAGGAPAALLEGLAEPASIALDGSYLYFTTVGLDDSSGRSVGKVSIDGGEPTYLATGKSTSAFAIAVDDTYAYWTAYVNSAPIIGACK